MNEQNRSPAPWLFSLLMLGLGIILGNAFIVTAVREDLWFGNVRPTC